MTNAMPLRAENLDFDQFESGIKAIAGYPDEWLGMRPLRARVRRMLNSLEEPMLMVSGPAGRGKTFSVLYELRKYCLEEHKIPRIYLYKRNSRVERLDNTGLARNIPEGRPDVYVFDDIHYVLDDAREGLLPVNAAIDLLEDANRRLAQGKKVILISGDLVRVHLGHIANPRLDELLLPFGEYNLARSNESEYFDRCNIVAHYLLDILEFKDALGICTLYGKCFEDENGEKLAHLFHQLAPVPRDLVALLNEVMAVCPNPTLESFIEATQKRHPPLPRNAREQIKKELLANPLIVLSGTRKEREATRYSAREYSGMSWQNFERRYYDLEIFPESQYHQTEHWLVATEIFEQAWGV